MLTTGVLQSGQRIFLFLFWNHHNNLIKSMNLWIVQCKAGPVSKRNGQWQLEFKFNADSRLLSLNSNWHPVSHSVTCHAISSKPVGGLNYFSQSDVSNFAVFFPSVFLFLSFWWWTWICADTLQQASDGYHLIVNHDWPWCRAFHHLSTWLLATSADGHSASSVPCLPAWTGTQTNETDVTQIALNIKHTFYTPLYSCTSPHPKEKTTTKNKTKGIGGVLIRGKTNQQTKGINCTQQTSHV